MSIDLFLVFRRKTLVLYLMTEIQIMTTTTVTVNNWDFMPAEIFDEIMFLLGSEDPGSLDVYRRVCRDWNEKIMNSLQVNPTTKWGDIISRRFELSWEWNYPSEKKISKALELEADGIIPVTVMQTFVHIFKDKLSGWPRPSLEEIPCAAILAHKGILVPETLELVNVNLASIPVHHLTALISSVTGEVHIHGVSGCDLVTILDSIRCRYLYLLVAKQSLGTEETEAMVKAMETYLERLDLYGDVVDVETLNKYSGSGKCCEVMSYGIAGAELREGLRSWISKGWEVTLDCPAFCVIKKT